MFTINSCMARHRSRKRGHVTFFVHVNLQMLRKFQVFLVFDFDWKVQIFLIKFVVLRLGNPRIETFDLVGGYKFVQRGRSKAVLGMNDSMCIYVSIFHTLSQRRRSCMHLYFFRFQRFGQ